MSKSGVRGLLLLFFLFLVNFGSIAQSVPCGSPAGFMKFDLSGNSQRLTSLPFTPFDGS